MQQFQLHHEDIALLMNIFSNIIETPTNKRFQNLNRGRIYPKFVTQLSIKVLEQAGFYESDDGKRLLYNITKLNNLKRLYDKLQLLSTQHPSNTTHVSEIKTEDNYYYESEYRWVFNKHNEWYDYDVKTTEHIEHEIRKEIIENKKQKFQIALKDGKHIICIHLNSKDMDNIKLLKSVQISADTWPLETNSNEMINITRIPSFPSTQYNNELELHHHKLKYYWYQLHENEYGDEIKKKFDEITAKQMEIALKYKKKSIILNKSSYYNCPKRKQLYTVEFDYYSIPPGAELVECVDINNISSTNKFKFENETTKIYFELKNKIYDTYNNNISNDPMLRMMVLSKDYYRPLSIKYWLTLRDKLNEHLKCGVCQNEFDETNFLDYWIRLKIRNKKMKTQINAGKIAIQLSKCCGSHFFCTNCIAEAFIKCKKECPICRVKYGITTGNQPDGIMKWKFDKYNDVSGKENRDKGLITITHEFQSGIQNKFHPNPGESYCGDGRVIYLPNTKTGREILQLTKIGWNRKILYTIGYSVSRKVDNCIIWNGVHFKTRLSGGSTNYGWPDIDYFDRVKEEFKQHGITVDDIEK